MHVGLIANAVHHLTFLGQGIRFGDEVSCACEVQSIAVKVSKITGDHRPFRVVPGSGSDTIPGVDGWLAICSGGAQVCSPGLIPCSGRSRELLAMSVGARQSSKVCAVSRAHAGYEKCHRLTLLVCRLLCQGLNHGTDCQSEEGEFHRSLQ